MTPPLPRRVLLITFGSLGDLHPYLAMGRALRGRGARVTLATHAQYRALVEAEGLDFAALPPGPDDLPMDQTWAERSNRPVRGLEYLVRDVMLPFFDEAERRLFEIAPGHDLVISHFLAFFVPGVAEVLRIPWLSCVLSPVGFFSADDPPALGILPALPRLRFVGPRLMRKLYVGLEYPARTWFEQIHAQRRRLGLAPLTVSPLFRHASPHGTLALFPETFAAPQPDWPARVIQTPFPLYARADEALAPDLAAFIAAGPPPVVFTLGTTISLMKSDFFAVARAACAKLGRRAVFVTGARGGVEGDAGVFVTPAAPFAPLYRAAATIVHHAGINSTALALAAGRPQVCVPFANDQFENARRVVALGAGRTLRARRLTPARLIRALAAREFRAAPPATNADFERSFLAALAAFTTDSILRD